ncbi:CBL-interacting serine/threonine-protein kinase 7 [Ricinus communis]|uniref:non-specific serine/threonine protein kinase n=1 Tax=Ricinus communis TaxID=3988 RepID=B9RTG4_RICCO|nr:CBL-interacting serine/threonine-protein kinase 7 [Ricinus communis]EEF45196.1 CBL-interacting serine/threonine-protein kinase, putative [Ricinus communis]|eukprot:XP_002517033.1 CBL-interacting serine/threonine-protein kinase 7 [Ricinus communis]
MEPPPRGPPLSRTTSNTLPTTLLNKYELGKLLGRGSFAKVYAARSLADNNKLVAIKIIDKTRTIDAAMEPRIICEISAMRRLQHHPNILKIHEVMATKTKIYLVMELALGGELFSKVFQRGKLSESKARRYFQQLVSALHFCHQNGVAHRDVKPQNLLLDANGNLKVSDFGLSALAEAQNDGSTVLQTACGTPAFTAPEVMARRGYDGAQSDAWSCGVILFFLLSAQLPFDDTNLAVMYKKIHKRDYQMPSASKSAKSIIMQLLDPNPSTRMSIEQLMKHSWFLKNYELPTQNSMFELEQTKCCKFDTSTVTAFDIISLSSGLDLSGLFEATNRREKRFTSMEKVERIMERVREVGGRLGYRIEEGKSGAIGLGKGRVALMFEALEIAEQLMVVEVKVVEGGGVEFEEVQWVELKDGLQDVVLNWHNDAM